MKSLLIFVATIFTLIVVVSLAIAVGELIESGITKFYNKHATDFNAWVSKFN